MSLLYKQRHEKTYILHKCKNKGADQLHGILAPDQRTCFRYINSTIHLLPKSEISSLLPSNVAVQSGLCQAWLETLKTGFVMRRLPIVTENSQSTKMSSSRRVSRPKQDDGEFLLECKAAFLSVYDDIGDRVGSKKDLLTGQYCKWIPKCTCML